MAGRGLLMIFMISSFNLVLWDGRKTHLDMPLWLKYLLVNHVCFIFACNFANKVMHGDYYTVVSLPMY